MDAVVDIPGTEYPEWAFELDFDNPLVFYDLARELYHNTRALISNSALKNLGEPNTPAHYKHWLGTPYDDPISLKKDDALVIGDAFHTLVLEPSLFKHRYILLPDFGTMVSSTNRAVRDAWVANEAGGRQPLTQQNIDQVNAMRDAVMANKRLRRIIENGRPEVTIAWIDPETGLPCKGRIDWVSEIEGVALDLKSALSGSPQLWKRAAADHRYHVQDAFYTWGCNQCGLDVKEMVFAVAEKGAPWLVGPYLLKDRVRMAGELTYRKELNLLRECIDNNYFPGYSDDVIEIDFPAHALRILEENQHNG